MGRRLRRALRIVAATLVGIVVLAVAGAWLTQPKLFEATFLARSAGPGVFTFDDIPHGRVLSEAQWTSTPPACSGR
jgi:hypothetical protein